MNNLEAFSILREHYEVGPDFHSKVIQDYTDLMITVFASYYDGSELDTPDAVEAMSYYAHNQDEFDYLINW